ncbi:MAG: hypothetical protein H6626_04750 [Pseudobdellovibrionaceae bacterium]|nr:hypothetical protein [Bdellovibrionales bacterium]USN48401.1 MAG: hypothetical protein H6626_04750 [Pseudobdellovibrionaceae bacterium]
MARKQSAIWGEYEGPNECCRDSAGDGTRAEILFTSFAFQLHLLSQQALDKGLS